VELNAVELAQTSLSRSSLDETLLSVKGTPRSVTGDATLLSRALSNLIENAKSHGNGLAGLEVEFTENQVAFRAHDHGPGFEPEDLKRAFQSFFRGKGSGKGSSSLGLGLSLVRRIAQAHDGDAYAENAAEGGASVSFTVARRGQTTSTAEPSAAN
jgi:signal transduction histidine kinase